MMVCEWSMVDAYELKQRNNNRFQKIFGVQLKDLYKYSVSEYPIMSIEDPFDQDDLEHYGQKTAECGDKESIVEDDILVTNPTQVKKAIEEKTCNALLLKVNQIGSVTEGIEAVISKHAGWGVNSQSSQVRKDPWKISNSLCIVTQVAAAS